MTHRTVQNDLKSVHLRLSLLSTVFFIMRLFEVLGVIISSRWKQYCM